MKIAFASLLFIVVATASAQARLGETPDQLVARYGQPLNENDQKGEGDKIALANVTFQKGGFQIDVVITNGISVQESFKKINGQSITTSEARTLLSANGQGHDWEAPHRSNGGMLWVRDDSATGRLSDDGTFIIRSHELVAQETAAKKLEQKPSLEGF